MVIARAPWDAVEDWRRATSTAFLASTASGLPELAIVEPDAPIGSSQVLNRFDDFGEIVIRRAEAGRHIRLFVRRNGGLSHRRGVRLQRLIASA